MLVDLSQVTADGQGLYYQDLVDYELDEVLIILAVEWAIFLILALYFEEVLPIGPGVKRHPFFFLPKVQSCHH